MPEETPVNDCDCLSLCCASPSPPPTPHVPRKATISKQPTPRADLKSPTSFEAPSVSPPPPSKQGVDEHHDADTILMNDFARRNSVFLGSRDSKSPVSVSMDRQSAHIPEIMSRTLSPTLLDGGKMAVSIDFGTTFSGVAYGSSRIAGGEVQQILSWPGSSEHYRKVPTCLVYDATGQLLLWGQEAKNAGIIPGTLRCEWFKLFLEPRVLRDNSTVDPRLPPVPPGKKAVDLIIDYLSCLWDYARTEITRRIGAVADLNSADVWLTVPAAWDGKGCDMMRDAAIQAGLVSSAFGGDRDWRDRLHIITEPEAAAVHCAYLTDLHKLKPGQTFMICDAGGGTVDLAVYKILGELASLEIGEMCTRSGANCGALFLDLLFIDLVKKLLADHPTHLDPISLASFQYAFSDGDKLQYRGTADDNTFFYFTCFNVEDPHDPSVGLHHGQLAIPGSLLRREVFDPVVTQVLDLIEKQMQKVSSGIDALLLVGGFAGSEYLFEMVHEQFNGRAKVIARPMNADTATLRGAARYGLARRPLISHIISARSYIVKVKLPVEPEDRFKRPSYITANAANVESCDNRLWYLLARGAIVRRGQRVTAKFCKYAQNKTDSIFVATLYTSDSDEQKRYIDEGDVVELCKWTVNIANLPTFSDNAEKPHPHGFYTEFELGLELDSAEVRGVLLYDGETWGTVVFDFLD